jgi:hypothetical protein
MNVKVNEMYKIAKNTFSFFLSFIHLPVLIMAESSALCCFRQRIVGECPSSVWGEVETVKFLVLN